MNILIFPGDLTNCLKADDFVRESFRENGFSLLYDFGVERTVPASWWLHFDGTVFALRCFAHFAVSPVLATVTLVLGEMFLHLVFQS